MLKGKSDDRFDNWGKRIGEVITGWLGQKKVLQIELQGNPRIDVWGFDVVSEYVGFVQPTGFHIIYYPTL